MSRSQKYTITNTVMQGRVNKIFRILQLLPQHLMLNRQNIINPKPSKITTTMLEANMFTTTTNEIRNGWRKSILWSIDKYHQVVYELICQAYSYSYSDQFSYYSSSPLFSFQLPSSGSNLYIKLSSVSSAYNPFSFFTLVCYFLESVSSSSYSSQLVSSYYYQSSYYACIELNLGFLILQKTLQADNAVQIVITNARMISTMSEYTKWLVVIQVYGYKLFVSGKPLLVVLKKLSNVNSIIINDSKYLLVLLYTN